jgi:hypothetical protein
MAHRLFHAFLTPFLPFSDLALQNEPKPRDFKIQTVRVFGRPSGRGKAEIRAGFTLAFLRRANRLFPCRRVPCGNT